jgi:hypothetical protein
MSFVDQGEQVNKSPLKVTRPPFEVKRADPALFSFWKRSPGNRNVSASELRWAKAVPAKQEKRRWAQLNLAGNEISEPEA